MEGYSLNTKRIEEELNNLRKTIVEKMNSRTLTWQKEGIYLLRIDELKKDLELARREEFMILNLLESENKIFW